MLHQAELEILMQKAIQARENAYAPYSEFAVGASLLSTDGEIFIGCNFENVSFGAGTCAERVALGNALTHGKRKFSALCICAESKSLTPCGICRQAFSEFGDVEVLCCTPDGILLRRCMLSDLLPLAFSSLQ